jgi:hypothetical protein
MVSLAHVLREGGGSHTNACLSGPGFELVYVGPTLPVIPETSSLLKQGQSSTIFRLLDPRCKKILEL